MRLRNDQVELITDEMMLAFGLDNNKTEKYTILCVEFYIVLLKLRICIYGGVTVVMGAWALVGTLNLSCFIALGILGYGTLYEFEVHIKLYMFLRSNRRIKP